MSNKTAPGIEMEQLSNLQECRHTEPGAETFGRMTSSKNIQETNNQVETNEHLDELTVAENENVTNSWNFYKKHKK